MKLALYFLSCCIAASWQQNPHLWSSYRPGHPSAAALPEYGYSPQLGPYYPGFNDYPAAAYYNRFFYPAAYQQQQYLAAAKKAHAIEQEEKKAEILARFLLAQKLASMTKQQPDSDDQENKQDEVAARVALKGEDPESRSFLFPALFYKAQILQTITKYSFVTSTLTSLNLISCIPALSFAGGLSNVACRRKRDFDVAMEAIKSAANDEAADGSLVNPSPVVALETTAMPVEALVPSSRSIVELNPSMAQAKDDDNSFLDRLRYYLNGKGGDSNPQARTGIFGSTTISTVTTYSITTVASKKTVSLGSSLSCLPSGYSLC